MPSKLLPLSVLSLLLPLGLAAQVPALPAPSSLPDEIALPLALPPLVLPSPEPAEVPVNLTSNHALSENPQDLASGALPAPAPAAPAALPPPTAVTSPESAFSDLARSLAAGERPRILERSTHLEVPFGHETPTLRCAPLRVCVVELEDGEIVLHTMTGDSERWLIDQASAGPGGRTPVLAIKPTDCDLSTNLVVTTDRRLYQLLLSAPPCPAGQRQDPRAAYTPHLRFYYPDALVREWTSAREAADAAAGRDALARIPLAGTLPLADLNFRYRWSRSRFPWEPESVFDDGHHTYILLPAAARRHPTPVLLLLRDGRASDLLNYSYHPGPDGTAYYVTDRVLDRAALVLGSGRRQRRLTLVNSALAR